MVTGTLPFDGADFKTLSQKIRSGRVEYPRGLSRGTLKLKHRSSEFNIWNVASTAKKKNYGSRCN